MRHSKSGRSTSALGQKQTSAWRSLMSALPPKADIVQHGGNVRFVPEADMQGSEEHHYSITSSARSRAEVGNAIPIALAVLRLIMNSNFVGCSTGRSAGFAPLRILAT